MQAREFPLHLCSAGAQVTHSQAREEALQIRFDIMQRMLTGILRFRLAGKT